MLNNGQFTIIKMAAVRPHLLMDWNHFRADTTRLLVEHVRQVSKNPTSGLGGDAIKRLLQC